MRGADEIGRLAERIAVALWPELRPVPSGERATYGEKYGAAVAATGYAYQTLRNAKGVAEAVELSRRRDNLTWAHHAEVAALQPKEQNRRLDWKQIPVHVVPLKDIARGEFHENAVRLDFQLSEMDAIRRALEPEEKAAAKGRKGRHGQPRSGKFPEQEAKGDTRDKVAAYLGKSSRTLEKAAAVVAAAIEKAARARQRAHGGTAPGRKADTSRNAAGSDRHAREASAQLGRMAGVSGRLIDAARLGWKKAPRQMAAVLERGGGRDGRPVTRGAPVSHRRSGRGKGGRWEPS